MEELGYLPSVFQLIWFAFRHWALTAVVLVVLYVELRYVWELIPVSGVGQRPSDRAVFVAGADSGFGYQLAVRCARTGMTVFAGCRTEEARQKIERKTNKYDGFIVPVELDVLDERSVAAAADFVKNHLTGRQKLWALINHTGYFALYGPDEWCRVEDYKEALDINFFGMIRCTHAFLPLLKASKGRIISMSSVCGNNSFPGLAPYCVTKYAIEAWMDSMRQELSVYGIECSIIKPGGYRNRFMDVPSLTSRVNATWQRLTPEMRDEYGVEFKQKYFDDFNFIVNTSCTQFEQVVDDYYHAITAKWPRKRYHSGWQASVFYQPLSYLPTTVQDFVIQLVFNFRRVPAVIRSGGVISTKTN